MSFHKKLDSFTLVEGYPMHGKRKKWGIARFFMALLMVAGFLLATGSTVSASPENCGSPSEPRNGAIATHEDANVQMATFGFELTGPELANLQCVAPFVEIDFHLEGLWYPPQWDDYIVLQTNLPGAIHDVAAGDFVSATPGVTRVRVAELVAGRNYTVTIAWPRMLAKSGETPGVWVAWVPSRWAEGADQVPYCAVVPFDWRGEAWCIFPYDSVTYRYRRLAIGIDQLDFGGNHVYGFGTWAFNQIPPDIQMLPTISSSFNFAAYLQPVPSRQMFLRGDSAVFAKDSFGDGGWTQETDPGSINKIAAGGGNQLVLNACNAVYARTTIGNAGWIQETPCGGAKAIAVSNTGLRMLIDANDAVWAKYGMGYGGWTKETDDNTAYAIAAGGDTQVIITACRAIYAKNTIGMGGWNHEVGCGNANAIAVDNTGLQAFIRGDAAVFAKRGISDGGWQQQVGPGNAGAIAAGGGVLMFLRGDSAVFAKTNIGIDGGWVQETDPGTANLIDVGDNGRQMIRTGDNAVWAKDGIGNGGWRMQAGAGNANAIAVG